MANEFLRLREVVTTSSILLKKVFLKPLRPTDVVLTSIPGSFCRNGDIHLEERVLHS